MVRSGGGLNEYHGAPLALDTMQIPSRDDWGQINENDLDAKWAFDAFLGKSFAEAEAMFEKNALYYQEDLQSMPHVPFNYYAPALVKYITSDRAKGDSDGASSFLRLIIWLLKSNRTVMTPQTEQALVAAAEQVAGRQDFYEADLDIYGDFADLYKEISELSKDGI
jgi:hypothetical protein